MYKNKRGQAALEFLMTYGWAILSAIIVIGALGSYFYFNQGGSTSIFMNAPFYGLAASADESSGLLSLEIENKGGETLNVTSISVPGCTENNTYYSTSSGAEIRTLACAGLAQGESFSGDITITYLRPGSALALTSTGSVSTPIVA